MKFLNLLIKNLHNGRDNDFLDESIDCDCIHFGYAITFHSDSVVLRRKA